MSARAARATVALACGLLLAGPLGASVTGETRAQDQDAGEPSRIEIAGVLREPGDTEGRLAIAPGTSLSLRTGFVPDPVVIRGTVTPRVPLAPMGQGCAGASGSAPTQRVRLETRFGFLRIFATGADDLTLAVQTSQGVICSDDRFGRHPSIEGRFAPGDLVVWVGTKSGSAEAHPFELEITETRSIRPGVRRGEESERLALAVEAGLDVRPETGLAGDIRLRRGFLPDPRFLEGATTAATDHVDVGGVGHACRGFVPAQPAHVITLRDDLDFFQVYVAEAPESTTIIVVGPDGSVSCDAADGDHPHVSRPAWPAGLYRVWVGAHRVDAAFPYRLGLSEIRRAR